MIFLEVGKIEGFWRELLLALCKPVYQLIVYLYELFEVVATAEIITNESLSMIYNRVGLLLGMYMMFRIIFSFIQMLINPDYITDKEKGIGNIVKKAILVVVLLGITPFIFNKAIELQNFIVGVETKDNVIAKLIFPKEIIGSDRFGAVLSASLFDSFYRYDEEYEGQSGDICYIKPYGDESSNMLYSHIINTNGNINAAKTCLDYTWTPSNDTKEVRYQIAFTQNGLFALVVGAVVCYILLTYTLSVGARVIQLAFLRLISPMAILGYLSPKKDGMFEKWLKMCVTTYIDLFVRMAIIFFIVFMVDAIIGSDTGIALNRPYDHMWIVNIVMILALLLFGKKAPELLKELFPSSGGAASLGFGLKSPKKIFDSMLGGSTLYKGLTSGVKRAYGAAAVGFMASQRNFRKGVGKVWDATSEYRASKKKLNDASLTAVERDKAEADMKKARNQAITWAGRATFGSAYSVLGGARRGLMTTNKSGRKTAASNAVDKTQASYKLHDAGYGTGVGGLFSKDNKGREGLKMQIKDIGRGFVGRDQYIEEYTEMSDSKISAMQDYIRNFVEDNKEINDFFRAGKSFTVSKTHPGMYLYVEKNGESHLVGSNFKDSDGNDYSSHIPSSIKTYVDLNADLGKAKGQNKALHQKENEKKSNKGN